MIVHIVTSLKDFFTYFCVYMCLCTHVYVGVCICTCVEVREGMGTLRSRVTGIYRTSDLLQVVGSELWSLVLLVAELAL